MLDVLRPELVWVEGRCYRVVVNTMESSSYQEHDLYDNEYAADYAEDEYDSEEEYEVLEISPNKYTAQLHVPQHYLGSVIGKKAATKLRIERETGTEIKIPRQGQGGDITVCGRSVPNVRRAINRINMVVMSSRMRQKPTHFISIPLNSSSIMESYVKFKETVLAECSGSGLDETLFINPQKLHLTIAVMCLMDNEERVKASNLLLEAKEKIVIPMLENNLPLKIKLKGLSYMNDDPADMSVLYGCVQDNCGSDELLQQLCDAIHWFFRKKGFTFQNYNRDNILLHVTLMNKRYKYRNEENNDNQKIRQDSFDGSQIIEKYADWDFGVMELKEIHLSQMHCETSGQYYNATSIIYL